MKRLIILTLIFILFVFSGLLKSTAGEPCCHILICCRGSNDGKSDGWGYRNYSQSVDGKVRFVSPNGGIAPGDPWYRIGEEAWRERVEWADDAAHYSIYGSYDDTCDAIHWGIADTKSCDVPHKKYPDDQPYLYYNVVKEVLTKENDD